MKSLLLAWVLSIGTVVSGIARPAAADVPARPNVLFIAIDDLRPELGCYGVREVRSPHIDRLAGSGMLFERAYCQQAVCLPSRASMITGARPDTTRCWDLSTHFRKAMPDVVTLPQLFKNHGYFTQAMGKICHHGYDDAPSWSVPTTFPTAPHGAGPRQQDPDGPRIVLSAKGRGPVVEIVDGPDNSLHDGQLADMAVAAIKDLKRREEPFFLAVGFIKPHLPFNVPRDYWDLYDPEQIPLAANPFSPKDAPAYAIPPGGELRSYSGVPEGWPIKEDFARKLKHGYYAAVSYVDAQVGRILDELDRQGMRDTTIVVLWGDHGWKLGEHQAWAKHSNVENDTRAPLILSVPGMRTAGGRTNALVEFVDIYPTLAELAGLPLPGHLEGTSFTPLLSEPEQPWKTAAFSQYPRGRNMMGYSMRTDRYRYTKWVHTGDHSKVSAVELYDHQADPQENVNIAVAPKNQALLSRLDQQWKAGWKPSKPTQKSPGKVSMDFWITEGEQAVKIPPTMANVPYGKDPLQVLDFWKAASDAPAPLVFFIHGGAWRTNDKDKVTGLRQYLPAGISVVSINYRFIPAADAADVHPPVKWPLEDAARALQFVRSKAAEWNIDKTRIGASGGSAGACTSLWLAFHDDMADPGSSDPIARESTRPSCVGVVGAQTSLDPRQMKEWIPNISYGGHAFGFNPVRGDKDSGFRSFLENRENILPWIKEYSPYELVTADDPPVFLHYADAPALGQKRSNATHSANFGVKLRDKLRATGVECHLMYLGAPAPEFPDPVAFLIARLAGNTP